MTDILKLAPMEQEPKRKNRFVVEFPNEFEIKSYLVQKINGSKVISVNKEIKDEDGFPSNIVTSYKWDNFTIELIDVIKPSTSQAVMNMVKHCNDKLGDTIKFTFHISILNPIGDEIEKWAIQVKELKEVNFGDLDYEIGEIKKIKVILVPAECTLLF